MFGALPPAPRVEAGLVGRGRTTRFVDTVRSGAVKTVRGVVGAAREEVLVRCSVCITQYMYGTVFRGQPSESIE